MIYSRIHLIGIFFSPRYSHFTKHVLGVGNRRGRTVLGVVCIYTTKLNSSETFWNSRTNLYVPEVHPASGLLFCEYEDEAHVEWKPLNVKWKHLESQTVTKCEVVNI